MKRVVPPVLAALSLVVSLTGSQTGSSAPRSAWSARARARMVADALKVAPPVLARLIAKHVDALQSGLDEAILSEGEAQHRQDTEDPSSGAAAAMGVVAAKAVAALDGHRPIADLVFYLGVLAHLAADTSDPLLTAPKGSSAAFAGDFPSYVERNLDRFPPVFYGYAETSRPMIDEAIASAKLSRDYHGHLARAYAEAGGSSASFDVRSIPFGVASLCYSRGVTSIARAWLHVWREAHGDLTGTPYLPGVAAVESPRVASPSARAGAAPRGADASPGHEEVEGVMIGPRPVYPAEESVGADVSGADPNGTPITKTIIGKSRKRLSSAAHPQTGASPSDPNKPADPNS